MKVTVVAIAALLGILNLCRGADETIELKSINELPLVWAMPFDSCVQDVALGDRGSDPQIKAVQTEKAAYFYGKGRKLAKTILFELPDDEKVGYTLEEWYYRCDRYGYLSSDGNIVVKYLSGPEEGMGYGVGYNETGEKIFTQPFSGRSLIIDSCLVTYDPGVIDWYDFQGNVIATQEVGFALDNIIPFKNSIIADFDNEIRRYDLKGNLLWRSMDGRRRSDVYKGGDQIVTWREKDNKVQLIVIDEKGEIAKQIELPQNGYYTIRASKDGSHALAVAEKIICYFDLKNEKLLWRMDADVSGTELMPYFDNKLRISDDNQIVSFKTIKHGGTIGEQFFVNKTGKIILRYPLAVETPGYLNISSYRVFELLDNGRLILFDDFSGLKLARNPAFKESAK